MVCRGSSTKKLFLRENTDCGTVLGGGKHCYVHAHKWSVVSCEQTLVSHSAAITFIFTPKVMRWYYWDSESISNVLASTNALTDEDDPLAIARFIYDLARGKSIKNLLQLHFVYV